MAAITLIHASMEFFCTSAPHINVSKPLAAFKHNHRKENGHELERIEFLCNDYHRKEIVFTKAYFMIHARNITNP